MRALLLTLVILPVAGCGGASADGPVAPVADAGASPTADCTSAPAWNALLPRGTLGRRLLALEDGGLLALGDATEDGRQISRLLRYGMDGDLLWDRTYPSWVVEAALGEFESGPRDGRFTTMHVHLDQVILAGGRARFSEHFPGWVLFVDLAEGRPQKMATHAIDIAALWPAADGLVVAGVDFDGAFAVDTIDDDDALPADDGPRFTAALEAGESIVDIAWSHPSVGLLTHLPDPMRQLQRPGRTVQSARLRTFDEAGAVAWTRWVGDGFCNAAGVALEAHPQGGWVALVASNAVQTMPGANVLAHYSAQGGLRWTRKIARPTVDQALGLVADGAGFALTGAEQIDGSWRRWVGRRDADGLVEHGASDQVQAEQRPVNVARLADGRLAVISQNTVFVAESPQGCPRPTEDHGDVACDALTGRHAAAELTQARTLWFTCQSEPNPPLQIDGGEGLVCVDGAPAHAPLPDGLRPLMAPLRLHPLQSFATPVTVDLGGPGPTPGILLHDALDGSGWQRKSRPAQVSESGLFVLVEEI